jgi:hypothetical protein
LHGQYAKSGKPIFETVVFSQHPQLKSIKGKLLKLGARTARDQAAWRLRQEVWKREGSSRVLDQPQPLPFHVVATTAKSYGRQDMAAAKPVRAMRFDQLKIFTGNANPVLAGKICASLGCPLGAAVVKTFFGRRNPPANPGKRTRR